MKKKILIATFINVSLVLIVFVYMNWNHQRKLKKLEELGATFGYGMFEVLYVDLSNTKITNEDLKLLNIFSLEALNLTNTKVSSLESLHNQKYLLSLVLTGTDVPKDQITQIKKKLPSLKITKEKVEQEDREGL